MCTSSRFTEKHNEVQVRIDESQRNMINYKQEPQQQNEMQINEDQRRIRKETLHERTKNRETHATEA